MALSFPSFLFFSLLIITSFKGIPVYGEKRAHEPYHVVDLKTLHPNPYCIESTKDQRKRASLKVVYKYGPCSHLNQDKGTTPTVTEILSYDKSRVDSLQYRLRSDSARNNLNSSKATLPVQSGNYIVTLGLGTPKQDFTLTIDTASVVTWIQCVPCKSCYTQQELIFNSSTSQTYKSLGCTTPQCSQLPSATDYSPACTTGTCPYEAHYGDGSYSVGLFATETLTLTLTPSDIFPNFAFGCGIDNSDTFGGAAGLLCLGRNPLSLVGQTASKYGNYFSYCLPTFNSASGTLVFGKGDVTTNSASFKYTRLIPMTDGGNDSLQATKYFIEVVGIKVDGEMLSISPSVFSDNGGTIIDSGTVITRLQREAYDALRTRFRNLMKNYTTTGNPPQPFDTCYDFPGHETAVVPQISFIFGGNVEVPIARSGIIYDVNPTLSCLAFTGTIKDDEKGIFGSVQQQTLDVVYDVAGGMLGFGIGGCS